MPSSYRLNSRGRKEFCSPSADLHCSFVCFTVSVMVVVPDAQDLGFLRDKSQGTSVWEFLE